MKLLSLEEANEALKYVKTEEDIINILNRLDLSARDSNGNIKEYNTTVLYSNKPKQMGDIINTRTIDKTNASDFLSLKKNKDLQKALKRIYSYDDDQFDDDLRKETKESKVKQFLFKAEEGGAWNTVSKRFVEETSGKVVVIVGEDFKRERVFGATEYPTLLKSDNITTINGVPKDTFKKINSDSKIINEASKKLILLTSDIITKDRITNITIKDTSNSKLNTKNLNEDYMFKQLNRKENITKLKEIKNCIDNPISMANGLQKLGKVGSLIGLSITSLEAADAYREGDSEKAKNIIDEYIISSAESFVGGNFASFATRFVLFAFGITGGWPLIISSVAAGIFGGLASEGKLRKLLGFNNDNEKQKFENNLNDTKIKTEIHSHSQTITNTFDPLVLDLNNNGRIDTITLNNSKAFFDHNNDNIAYKSSWISKDDGLLVLDKNNNNLIDNGNELFGNFTEISSNSYALNGFEALKLLDSNQDGVIDINDKEFNNLKIWQDLNEDGITQINELKSLKDLNITSINLNYKDTNQNLDNDNTITQTATFIKDDKESLLADINFSVSSIERVFKDKIKYSEEELNLANLKGYGVLRDLRDAACLDTKLKALLKDYSSTNSKEEQLNKLDSLIYAWANTNKALNKDFNLSKTKEFDSNNPSNTDSIRDLWLTPSQAREYANFTISESLKNEFNELKQKISIINSFLGINNQDFYIASLNEFNELRNSFNNTYDSLRTYVYKGLLFQTRLKEYYDEISITSYENNGSYELKLDFSKSIEKFKAINETNPKKAFVDLAEFITSFKDINSLNDCVILLGDFIKTMNNYTLSDYLKLLDEDTINALSTQTGTSGNDTLVGTNLLNGKDTLYGLDGDDTLIGGIGDDTLVGGNGNDTYVFDKDFGHDTIINYKSNLNDIDCIKFNDASINANNLKYVRNYDDLMLIKDDNNSIRVKDFFAYEDLRNTIDEIKFANNTSINKDEIINRIYTPTNGDDNFTMFFTNKDYVITMLDGNDTIITHNGDDIIDGGDGDDIIRSGAGADIINGGNGNDDIYAGDGDDIIIGGAGDDILQGGMGNDKYIYKGVWGKDTIINLRNDNAYDEIILDVSSSFVKITRNNDDLIINKLKSAGWFRKVVDESSSIKVVDFFKKDYDISALVLQDKTLSANDLRQMVLTPTWGNDTLIGSEYSDKIYGLFGNDTLIGGKGDDYLDGGAGNDTYIFNRNDGNDYIKDALGYDTIKFNDISFSEVVLKKDVDNLIIKYNNNKDSVTILGNFGIGFNKIEKFVFSDKTLCYDEFINTAAKELPSYEDLVNKVIKPDLSSYLKNTERLIQDTNAYSPNSSGFITYTDDKNNNIQVYL